MRPTQIALVIVLSCFSALAESDEPFDIATVPAPQHPYAVDWRKVQDDWAAERKILNHCRAERERCPSREASQFLTLIDETRIRTGRARLGYVNHAINLAIQPMSDFKSYGVPEIWTAPLATLANGAGDCTDYAIAKYFALGEVGIPANDRRLVVVQTKLRREEHAVLAVRDDERWLILDNRSMTTLDATEATAYIPLLVLDHRDVRQFVRVNLTQMMRDGCAPGNN